MDNASCFKVDGFFVLQLNNDVFLRQQLNTSGFIAIIAGVTFRPRRKSTSSQGAVFLWTTLIGRQSGDVQCTYQLYKVKGNVTLMKLLVKLHFHKMAFFLKATFSQANAYMQH